MRQQWGKGDQIASRGRAATTARVFANYPEFHMFSGNVTFEGNIEVTSVFTPKKTLKSAIKRPKNGILGHFVSILPHAGCESQVQLVRGPAEVGAARPQTHREPRLTRWEWRRLWRGGWRVLNNDSHRLFGLPKLDRDGHDHRERS